MSKFSEDWRFPFSISSVSPPLLLQGESAKPLGPLLFAPSYQTRTLLFSSPSLLFQPNQSVFNNSLQSLKLPNNTGMLLFFPTGENSESVGYLKLSTKGPKPEIQLDRGNDAFTTKQEFKHRILGIQVSSSVNNIGSGLGEMVEIGFLSVFTLYAVHWYKVEIIAYGSEVEKPVLAYLGSRQFNHLVRHVCWNPHLPDESLVMLENGELYLFELGDCLKVDKFPFKLTGTSIKFSLKDVDFDSEKVYWLSCEFSWHPQIAIVCCSSAVFLVDWTFKVNLSILAKLDMFTLNHSVGDDQFIAFGMAGSEGFYYTVATQKYLFLLDVRKTHTPLLQWTHGLDNPCYLNVFKLSELRSKMKEDCYRWATDSGFVILLGSFLSGEFNIYCYGPPLPVPYNSVSSKVFDFVDTFYAWEQLSKLSLLSCKCFCGDCVLRLEFSSTPILGSSKERVSGFCILSEDLFPPKSETNGFCGFTLIRLVSPGKLELEKYRASWDLLSRELEVSKQGRTLQFDNSLPCLLGVQEYKFPRRFRYLHLDYLLGYMNGDLSKVMLSKMQNLKLDPNKTMSFPDCKVVCDMLKACGVDNIGSPPSITKVFNDISWPTSIYEVTSNRIWAGLPENLLKLAFTSWSNVLDILVDHRKINVDLVEVPDIPQMIPFLQKKPLSRSKRLPRKILQQDKVVGPLLPLPLLVTLREFDSESHSASENETSTFSAETELSHQCDIVMTTAKDMASSEPCAGLDVFCTPSLASDVEEKCVPAEEPRSVFLYKPSADSGKKSSNISVQSENATYEDEKHDTFISRRCEKPFSFDPIRESVGMEVFDDLCPIELNFDSPPMQFKSKELKGYGLLYEQFSKWQEGFKPYQDFCQASKIQASKKSEPSANRI